jgi:hypothetical protein
MNALGINNFVKHSFINHGFFGFYRGYSALLLFSVPKNYVRFGAYSYAQENLFKNKKRMDNLLCGMFAGAAEATLVVTP